MGLDCNFEFAFKTHRKMNGYNFRGWVSSEKSPENFVGKLAGKKCWKTHRKKMLENSPEKMLENSPENAGKLKGKKCWKTHRKKRWKT